MIKVITQIITFLLEITMLITYGHYGLNRPWDFMYRLLFAILIISVAVLLWSVFAAPKSEYRLEMPYLVIFRAGMFFIAAVFLFQSGYRNIAIALSAVTIVTQTTSYFVEK